MSASATKVGRDDIEQSLRRLQRELAGDVAAVRPQLVTLSRVAAAGLVIAAYVVGRRVGRRKSAVVEIRRI